MHRIPNTFRDDLKPIFGIPQIKPQIGSTFDKANDLWLHDACTVHHRDGHVTRGTPSSVTHDALLEWNRRHLTRDAFSDHYGEGEDRSESMMLHGANG